MRAPLVLIALLGSACAQEISLGTECPNSNGACPRIGGEIRDDADLPRDDTGPDWQGPNEDGGLDPETDLDAGRRDAGARPPIRDATVPVRDAAMAEEDAGPSLFPELLRNPSFELTDGGSEGELPPFDLIGIAPSPIDPWYTCRPTGTSVQSHSPLRNGPGMATDKDTYVTYTWSISSAPILNGLAQDLSEPLRSGQRYGFAIDVWSEHDLVQSGINPTLDVVAGGIGCIIGVKMGNSLPIEPGGWKKICVNFTPRTDVVRTIMLLPNTPSLTSALHIDNIRPDPQCGNY